MPWYEQGKPTRNWEGLMKAVGFGRFEVSLGKGWKTILGMVRVGSESRFVLQDHNGMTSTIKVPSPSLIQKERNRMLFRIKKEKK